MSEILVAALESDRRVRLPAEWAEALGLRDQVALERLGPGILIRPVPASLTWDDVFADKLPMGPVGSSGPEEDGAEISADDLLF
jgi:hypothetical protein